MRGHDCGALRGYREIRDSSAGNLLRAIATDARGGAFNPRPPKPAEFNRGGLALRLSSHTRQLGLDAECVPIAGTLVPSIGTLGC